MHHTKHYMCITLSITNAAAAAPLCCVPPEELASAAPTVSSCASHAWYCHPMAPSSPSQMEDRCKTDHCKTDGGGHNTWAKWPQLPSTPWLAHCCTCQARCKASAVLGGAPAGFAASRPCCSHRTPAVTLKSHARFHRDNTRRRDGMKLMGVITIHCISQAKQTQRTDTAPAWAARGQPAPICTRSRPSDQ